MACVYKYNGETYSYPELEIVLSNESSFYQLTGNIRDQYKSLRSQYEKFNKINPNTVIDLKKKVSIVNKQFGKEVLKVYQSPDGNWRFKLDNNIVDESNVFYQLSNEEKTPVDDLLLKVKDIVNRQITVYSKRASNEREEKAVEKLQKLYESLDNTNAIEAINHFREKSLSAMRSMGERLHNIKDYVDKKNFRNKAERDEYIRELNEIKEYNDSLSILQEINKVINFESLKDRNSSLDLGSLSEAVSINTIITDSYKDLNIPLLADYLFDLYDQGINNQLIKAGHPEKVMTREKLEEKLNQNDKDISWLESTLVATSNLDDAVLGLYAKGVKKQLYLAQEKDAINERDLAKAFEKYIKESGLSADNNKSLFGKMLIEVDSFGGEKRLKYLQEGDKGYDKLKADKPAFELYNKIIDLHLSSQKGIPNQSKLGYFLPSVEKSTQERIIEEGKIKGWSKEKNRETKYGLQTLEGKEYKKIPIHFSGMLSSDKQSLNLIRNTLLYTSEINKFKSLNEIQGQTNALQYLVNNSVPLATNSKGENIKDALSEGIGNTNYLKKELNRRVDKLNTFIDMAIYGITRKEERVTIFGKDVDFGRWGDRLSGFTAINALAGDLAQAFNNTVVGNMMQFAESVGGRNFSKSDWTSANAEYFKQSGSLLGDIGSGAKKSKITQLIKEFDAIQGQFKDNLGKNITGSTFGKLFEVDSIFALQNMTEHQIQATNLIAFLKATKIKNSNGQESDLYTAYEIDKNGDLKLKEGFDLSFDEKFDLMNKIHAANKKNNGVYNKLDTLGIQQYTFGRMAMIFRKFIVPTVRSRFGGESVDYESGLVNQGYYQSFGKKLIEAWHHKSLSLLFDFNSMTDHEKEGVKRSMVDFSIFVITFAMITALTPDDDDESGFVQNSLLYQAKRLNGDVSFYLPGIGFNDQVRVLNTPTAVYGTIKKASSLLGQVLSFDHKEGIPGILSEYKRDSGLNKKGDNKAFAKLKKLAPVYNNIIESLHPENALNILEKIKN